MKILITFTHRGKELFPEFSKNLFQVPQHCLKMKCRWHLRRSQELNKWDILPFKRSRKRYLGSILAYHKYRILLSTSTWMSGITRSTRWHNHQRSWTTRPCFVKRRRRTGKEFGLHQLLLLGQSLYHAVRRFFFAVAGVTRHLLHCIPISCG